MQSAEPLGSLKIKMDAYEFFYQIDVLRGVGAEWLLDQHWSAKIKIWDREITDHSSRGFHARKEPFVFQRSPSRSIQRRLI
jgi:hypothetical protein